MKKILITGVSSFTGMWFANTLADSNFKVFGLLTKNKHDYKSIELKRIKNLHSKIKIIDKTTYNSIKFKKILENYKFDYFHYHGCYTKNYDKKHFKFYKANHINNYNIDKIIKILKINNCKRFIYTGSIFEKNEGKYNESNEAISLYGLSKTNTYNKIKLYCNKYKLSLMKIVIPNPFGKHENKKFNNYIIKNWLENKTPTINFPNYIRDNVFIKDLINIYINEIKKNKFKNFIKINPSGYSCSNEVFVNILKENFEKIYNRNVNFNISQSSEHDMIIKRVNGYNNKYKIDDEEWIKYFQYHEIL